MNEEKKNEPLYSETAYDDAFRTMESECNDILIPFINYFFGEKYDDRAEVRRLRNEQIIEHKDSKDEKRITDSHIEISQDGITKKYHLECESKIYDGSILVRMFGYDIQIAKSTGEWDDDTIRVRIPYTGLILLRESPKAPRKAKVVIETPEGTTSYHVNILKESDFSIEKIFENRLYLLIPFYIFNYEKELKEINSDTEKTEAMANLYRGIIKMLDDEHKNMRLSLRSLGVIIKLTNKVVFNLAVKHENVQRKVGEIMGGEVLDLPEIRVYKEGEAAGRAEGLSEGMAKGEAERKKLMEEIDALKKELELLKLSGAK